MIKLLHSADWHLDSPIQGRTPEQTTLLRQALQTLPQKVVSLAKQTQCDLMLLSGDLFDGACSAQTITSLRQTLADAGMPVFIAPGNHDPMGMDSPWLREDWPENVHIFRSSAMESVCLPQLDCRVYGAAFQGADSPSLLQGFSAQCDERHALCVLHGDPTAADSPYNPITRMQVLDSGLDYLALGHIHKGDAFRAGDTLCAWPGCPMGRGFDELGQKGVLIVTVDQTTQAQFVPLPLPRFHWYKATVQDDPAAAIAGVLPGADSQDFFRVELEGECPPLDLAALAQQFPGFANLELRDNTLPPIDLWANAGDDTLEGVYFSLLQNADAPEELRRQAARITRLLLLGQEVALP